MSTPSPPSHEDPSNIDQAVRERNVSAVKTFLQHNRALISYRNESGYNLLDQAVMNNDPQMVQLLIEQGIDVNEACPDYQLVAIHYAASRGYLEMVQILVEAGANINQASNSAETALLDAARNGSVPVLCYLLEQGASLMHMDHDGDTALHLAASRGHKECLEYLILQGCSLEAKNHKEQTPLDLARQWDQRLGCTDIEQLMISIYEQQLLQRDIAHPIDSLGSLPGASKRL